MRQIKSSQKIDICIIQMSPKSVNLPLPMVVYEEAVMSQEEVIEEIEINEIESDADGYVLATEEDLDETEAESDEEGEADDSEDETEESTDEAESDEEDEADESEDEADDEAEAA